MSIQLVTLKEIEEAFKRIAAHIRETPVFTSTTLNGLSGDAFVYLKAESFQRGGAFKARGAFNALLQLTDEEKSRGVIAHSSGNHAQALALAAQKLAVKCTVVMPRNSPGVKVAAVRDTYKANVVFCEPTLQARESTTKDLIEKHNFTLVHPFDNPRIIAGAGTSALELVRYLRARDEELDCIFVPIGGGGICSGTATTVRNLCPAARVFGAEPYNARDAFLSFQSGQLTPNNLPTTTVADGLRTSLSPLTFAHIKERVHEIVTVTEQEILDAMRLLLERCKLVIEPSGAVPLAALLKVSKGGALKGKRCGVILTGGNVDLHVLFDKLGTA